MGNTETSDKFINVAFIDDTTKTWDYIDDIEKVNEEFLCIRRNHDVKIGSHVYYAGYYMVSLKQLKFYHVIMHYKTVEESIVK